MAVDRYGLRGSGLPNGKDVLAQGHEIAKSIKLGTSSFDTHYGVSSEVEYKKRAIANNEVLQHMSIGMDSSHETAIALARIYEAGQSSGYGVHSYSLISDKLMALPEDMWEGMARETGPMIRTLEDLLEITSAAPVACHLNDYSIGSPSSVRNVARALEAGSTYIGNLSQYVWDYPGWSDEKGQVIETVKALGMMAFFRDRDRVVDSYLPDGRYATFGDETMGYAYASVLKYIVEDLVGANLALAFGGLSANLKQKAAMLVAFEHLMSNGPPTSFYYGNTISYFEEVDRNYPVLALDVVFMQMISLRYRTGAAILPVPVTEVKRVPNTEEIIQAHTVAGNSIGLAGDMMGLVNWEAIEEVAEDIATKGRSVYERILNGLEGDGVDLTDPLALLYALRRISGPELERQYGLGREDTRWVGGREPIYEVDLVKLVRDMASRESTRIRSARTTPNPMPKLKILVGCTDVHMYALYFMQRVFEDWGFELINLGVEVEPSECVAAALEHQPDVIALSTNNGWALEYAERLMGELRAAGIGTPVVLGGRLNQKVEGVAEPVDVVVDLRRLGVYPCPKFDDFFAALTISSPL